jgi:hypothetical protein
VRRLGQRGQTIAVFLLFLSLIVAVTFALAGRNIARLQMQTREIDGTVALALAKSGLATTIARFKLDKELGTHNEVFREVMPSSRDAQAAYVVEFGTPVNGKLAAGKSVNNHRGDNRGDTVVWVGENKCPKNGLLLSAVGTCNKVSRRVTVILDSPPFDHAVAAAGPIRSRNGMVLGSVPRGFDIATPIDPAKLEPASLLTQAADDGDGPAVWIRGSDSHLAGDLKAVGSIRLEAGVEHSKGQELANSNSEDIPVIGLDNFASDSKPQLLKDSSFDEVQAYSGQVEWEGKDLFFKQGLQLDGATLRIKGNVTISGGVSGVGALICDGNVTITGTNALRADNQVALLAGGDVSILGVSRDQRSTLQGIIYAHGPHGVHIENATVLGTVLAAGKGSPIEVEQATIARLPGGKLDFDLGWTGYPKGGIVTKAFAPGEKDTTLKLLPLVGADGNLILEPKPKDFLAAGITTLTAANFSFDNGQGQVYYAAGTDAKVIGSLGSGAVVDGGGTQLAAAWENVVRNSGDKIDQMKDVLKPDPSTGRPKAAPKFELNQFLKTNDRLRIVRRID